MKIKRFFAKDMRSALTEVKEELGPDAVIMSNKKMADGVEIVAAVDYDKVIPQAKSATQQPKTTEGFSSPSFNTQAAAQERIVRPRVSQASASDAYLSQHQSQQKSSAVSANQQADSLDALLKRQNKKVKNQFGAILDDVKDQQEQAEHWYQPPEDSPLQQTQFQTKPIRDKKAQAEKDPELTAMRTEMAAIRKLLEHQVSGLMDQEVARRDPTRAMMTDRLKGMGVCENLAGHLACYIPDDVSESSAWDALLNMVKNQLHTTQNEILRQGGVFSLVGPTGVGKTTTVAKLAALGAQKFGANKVALITTDTYRIGAYEQLSTYGRIIGCPVKQVKDASELADTLYQLRNRKLVLIDTAGMSQRDLRLTEQLSELMRSVRVNIRNYLVLSATAQRSVMLESIKHFKKVTLSGCIFTKLDECLSLGEIISVAIQNSLPIGYLTNGQRVPEDIRVANAEKLVKKAEQLYEKQASAQIQRQSHLESRTVGMYD